MVTCPNEIILIMSTVNVMFPDPRTRVIVVTCVNEFYLRSPYLTSTGAHLPGSGPQTNRVSLSRGAPTPPLTGRKREDGRRRGVCHRGW